MADDTGLVLPASPKHQDASEPAQDLIDELAAAMRRVGTNRQFAVGDVLCGEGHESHEAFVIINGCVDARVVGHCGEMIVARHRSGAIVGEVTTLIGGHRTATLVASEPSVVSVIDRGPLQTIFDEHPAAATAVMLRARERTDRSRVAALLSEELQAPDGAVVAAIADRVTWRSLEAGDALFSRGDAADAAYLVVSGRLGVTDLGPTRGEAEARTIQIGRGGIVGEFGLLEDRERSATVTALRDTELARLSSEDFAQLAKDHTALAMGLVRRVLDRSGIDSSNITTKRSFALAITAPVSDEIRSQLTSTITEALDRCGSTVRLTATSIDEGLRQPGISNVEAGGFGEIRLAELLHQAETDADQLVLDTGVGLIGSDTPDWTRRALRYGDQLVVITSPDPDDDETAAIREMLDATPDRIPRWLALLHPSSCRQPSGTAALRQRFGVDEILHLRGASRQEIARLARLAAGQGVGLVLSGGGARGHAHIGVYAVLDDLGVPVDRVIGSSMGSIVAGCIGQQLSPDRLLSDMQRDAENLFDYTIPLVSLIKGQRIVEVLERQFDGWDIEDLWVPFRCVSTDLTTAESVTHSTGPASTAIRTSIAIPGVLPPVAHDGHLLADGGVLDNLPVGQFANDPSIGVIIASDVAPPLGPSAKSDFGLSVSGWKVARSRAVPRPIRRAKRAMERTVTSKLSNAASSKIVRTVRRTPKHRDAEFVAETVLPGASPNSPASSAGTSSGDPLKFPGVGTTLMRSLLIGSSRSRDAHLASGVIDLYLELDLRDVPLLDFSQVGPAADAGRVQSRAPITKWLDAHGGSPWGHLIDDHPEVDESIDPAIETEIT